MIVGTQRRGGVLGDGGDDGRRRQVACGIDGDRLEVVQRILGQGHAEREARGAAGQLLRVGDLPVVDQAVAIAILPDLDQGVGLGRARDRVGVGIDGHGGRRADDHRRHRLVVSTVKAVNVTKCVLSFKSLSVQVPWLVLLNGWKLGEPLVS